MATGINPITVAEAGPIMARAMNMSWTDDRSEVVTYLNKYRLHLYTNYDDYELFNDTFHCLCVQTFNSECQDSYQGFTLPEDIMGPEAVWAYGLPLKVRSRWREAHTGLGINPSSRRVEAVTMAETFATERDLQKITKVKIFTEHEKDSGKVVHLEVIDASGRQKTLAFTLVHNGFAIVHTKIKKILSVSLPTERVGSLTLSQSDGYELSIYKPSESVPAYKRMKVQESNCPSTVIVQGTKRFVNVYFDHDIVEIGNALVIEEAGKFFRYGESTTETNEIKTAEYHRELMNKYLIGEISRNRAHAVQDNTVFKARGITAKKTLAGYRK